MAGNWHLGLYVCLAWTGSDVILSTTSIMHLCAIALYRYVGIVYPLRMRSAQEARHVVALVVPAWTIAVALSVPFVVQGASHSGSGPRCVSRRTTVNKIRQLRHWKQLYYIKYSLIPIGRYTVKLQPLSGLKLLVLNITLSLIFTT